MWAEPQVLQGIAMLTTARLTIDIDKITDNARRVVEVCQPYGLTIMGITKGACGLPPVARALLAGGIRTLGDARLDNIARLREAGIEAPTLLIRSPAPSEVAPCVELADGSLNADLGVVHALSAEAAQVGKRHGVILMVDIDTGREGLLPGEVTQACREVAGLPGLTLGGLGVYFIADSTEESREPALQRLVALAREVEQELGFALPIISGGSTNVFRALTWRQRHVPGVSQLRLGTVILLGIASSRGPIRVEELHQDTFVLDAEIIEIKPRDRLLGILSLGKIDTEASQLFPTSPGVSVLDMSSDHTIVDLSGMSPRPRVGDRVAFELGYTALSRAAASPYVRVEYRR